MTTVEQLIKELEKMPKDQYVLLNNNTKDNIISVYFTDLKVESHEIKFPTDTQTTKQKVIILNQGGII